MAEQAILKGKLTRVVKICNANVTEFTIAVKETKMDGTTFTIGTKVSGMVEDYVPHDAKTYRVCAMATGDEVTIIMDKHPSQGWEISSLRVHRPSCRSIKKYLKDLEKELAEEN